MFRIFRYLVPPAALLLFFPVASGAQDSWSRVDVGRRHARADAGTSAPRGIARTETRVGRVNLGRGLAVGYGPNGVSLSHSIGVNHGGVGTAHNFQMSVGPHGTHVGHGGVVTSGGNSRVITGGESWTGRGGAGGGNFATGHGRRSDTWSRSSTRSHAAHLLQHFSRR